ncbi:hypothetical protein [Bradyrhizobium sp. B117]|uniref:hypothetical protein n=1 Tax=Bradyrhizobium sp. B117 TaxID=3140246 RepID=UPI0031840562
MVEDQRVEREERKLVRVGDRDDAYISMRPQQGQHGGDRRNRDQDTHFQEEREPRAAQRHDVERQE